jgi:group I intron endonuclease
VIYEKGDTILLHFRLISTRMVRLFFSLEIVRKTSGDVKLYEQKALDEADRSRCYNLSRYATCGDLITYHPERDRIVAAVAASVRQRNARLGVSGRKRVYGRSGTQNGMFGKTHTEAARRKISEHHRGNTYAKGAVRTKNQRARLAAIASLRVGKANGFYGKRHSLATRKKIAKANRGKTPSNARPIIVAGIWYESVTDAARALKVSPALVVYRLKSEKYVHYQYVDKCLTTILKGSRPQAIGGRKAEVPSGA